MIGWIGLGMVAAMGSVAAETVAELGPVPFPTAPDEVRLKRSVAVPMRDRVHLSTDLYFPRMGQNAELPTILIRTPYNKSEWREPGTLEEGSTKGAARFFAGNGYVVAIQDVRGKWESGGMFSIYSHILTDFTDTLEWIVAQEWSDGQVATYGCSYLGETQVIQATTRHPALKAVLPQAAGGALGGAQGRYRYFGVRNGGAFELGMALGWFTASGSRYHTRFPADLDRETLLRIAPLFDLEPEPIAFDFGEAVRSLPLIGLLRRLGAPPTDWDDYVSWPMVDERWVERFLTQADSVDVPGLHVNSWYDLGVAETIATWRHFSEKGESSVARDHQHLIIGGGVHCANELATANTVVGRRPIGDARLAYWDIYLAWFDHWLKGDDDALRGLPKVQYYLLGRNEWRASSDFPPPDTRKTAFYLSSEGQANSLFGDGRLSRQPVATDAGGFDTFVYDPGNPVPSLGGPLCCTGEEDMPAGSFDQTPIESRADVLVYETEPLNDGLTVAGPVELILYVSSSGKDTDFTGKLVDVYPDGRAFNVQEGILRARYRDGYDREVFMEPGKVYELVIDLQATANYFAPGHRIRIEVSSSNFPRWDRNLNTGGNNYDETAWQVVRNTVHHGPKHPSKLLLYILQEDDSETQSPLSDTSAERAVERDIQSLKH